MTTKHSLWISMLVALMVSPQAYSQPSFTVTVQNPTSESWVEVPVVLPWTEAMNVLGKADPVLVGPEILPAQRDDLDGDGRADELVFLVSLGPQQSKRYKLQANRFKYKPPIRAHAGMYLDNLLSVAWESDVVAYRLYWNDETAIDIFCKTRPILSLQAWTSPDISHHVESKYGLDVLKVGPSLGLGGFGVWLVVDRAVVAVFEPPVQDGVDIPKDVFNTFFSSSSMPASTASMN